MHDDPVRPPTSNHLRDTASRTATQMTKAHFIKDLAFVYNALPCGVLPPTMQSHLTPSAFRAALQAIIQGFFLLAADCFLLTTLPYLFFMRSEAFKPLFVCSLAPFNTKAFAIRPH